MAIGIDTSFLVASEIAEHPGHSEARNLLRKEASKKSAFALCPQVLGEFVHVVTDARRFQKPVPIDDALQRAETIWNAKETRRVFGSEDATALFLQWMSIHRLGRKRILDTQLASIYYSNNIKEVATTDFRDFRIFEVFKIHTIQP